MAYVAFGISALDDMVALSYVFVAVGFVFVGRRLTVSPGNRA
jgi:hypothetical protein